jgi:hypothetical protein
MVVGAGRVSVASGSYARQTVGLNNARLNRPERMRPGPSRLSEEFLPAFDTGSGASFRQFENAVPAVLI